MRHELLHALGFSASLYAFYRDKKGNPRTARDDRGNPPLDLQLRVRKWSESTIKMVRIIFFSLLIFSYPPRGQCSAFFFLVETVITDLSRHDSKYILSITTDYVNTFIQGTRNRAPRFMNLLYNYF